MVLDKKSVVFSLIGVLLLFVQASAGYFQQPAADFITNPAESTYELAFYTGDVSGLQMLLDDARTAYPNEVLIVHVRGFVTVGETPLTLGSKTCLSFEGCGRIAAANDAISPALIQIQDAEYVSITAFEESALATLDGRGLVQTGILVSNSGKVNIDNVNISGCTDYGVDYSGRGNALLNDAGSVTRCEIPDSGISGIRVRNSARFVLMDNVVTNSANDGIDVYSQSATVVGNTCTGNQTGIKIGAPSSVDGPDAAVARNVLTGNTVGLELASSTQKHLVTENVIHQNGTGIIADGYRNHIFNNDMDNSDEFNVGGSGNIIVRHENVVSSEATAGAGTKFFDPPTIGNPHSHPVIVPGMGRRDLTFTQQPGDPDVDLATVQSSVNSARSTYPNDILVIWLNGTFVARGEHTGLDMPQNSCVILNGTIYPEGAGMDRNSDPDHYQKGTSTGGTQLILMNKTGYMSFSGGTLDCRRLCAWGIYAPADNVGLIDGVTVKEAVDNNIGVLYHTGDSTPMFIRGCQLNGGGYFTNRGVWVHVCSYVHCISNHSEGHVADSFDFDAVGNWSTALFNTCYNEKRTGVFIEEGASNNFIVGNTMTGPVGNGISLYDTVSTRQCYHNIIVGNTVTGPNGMNIRHAQYTFAFNNIMNTGQFGVYLNVTNNYSAQNISVLGNYNLSDITNNPFFTAPYASYVDPRGDCTLTTNLEDFAALASGWLDSDPKNGLVFFEDFEGLANGNLDGQDGWSQFFAGGSMLVGGSSAIQGTKGVIGTVADSWSTAKKLTGVPINFATDDVTLYLSSLVKYTGTKGDWFYAMNTGSNNGAIKLEGRFQTTGCRFAGLYGYSETAIPSWQPNKVYAAVMKIDTISPTQLEMSIGLFDVTNGLPDENTLTYTLVKTYDRTLANYNYNYLAFGAIDNVTIGDNLTVATEWSTVQAMVAGELADPNWPHAQSDWNLDGNIDLDDLLQIVSLWLYQ